MKTALLYRDGPMPATVAVGPERTRTVLQFDDLDLSYDIDVRVLYRRIRNAALAYSELDSIVAATVAAIHHPKLSEHHRRMTL